MSTLPRKYPGIVKWGLVAAALALAWGNRFVQDDAFISFRYARNLAEGHGLVYNIGERVEGYTNFLWTVCMAAAFPLRVDVVAWGYALSLAAFAVTLLVTARLAERWFKSRPAGLLAVILLAANYSFCCYATGGLETQFGIAWIMLSVWLLHAGRLVPAALCSACSILTRMDSVLILFPFWCAAASFGDLSRGSFQRPLRALLSAGAGALVVLVWLICRYRYYGAWVPNTFLIKGQGPTALRGLCYAGLFYAVYGLWLAVPFLMRKGLARREGTACGFNVGYPALASILLWHLYVIAVGGDFMEFRMMMPTLPLVMLFIAEALVSARPGEKNLLRKFRIATAPVLVGVSLFLGVMRFEYPMLLSISHLATICDEWDALSGEMAAMFGEQRESVTIGITAAGVVPFRTQMPTLDLLGLNSREVALTGTRIALRGKFKCLGNRPGHSRVARWETVIGSDVNLLINHPWIVRADSGVLSLPAEEIALRFPVISVPFPKGHAPAPPVIAWPLKSGNYWLTIYTKPHPAVDDAIRRVGATLILPTHE